MYDGEITDPHHHLWSNPLLGDYVVADLRDDCSVADITKTVFIECQTAYREDGPEHLRPVGETEWVAGLAEQSEARRAETGTGPVITGIVAHADLTLDLAVLDEVLDAHTEAAGGRFRGIRDALSSAEAAGAPSLLIPGHAEPGKAADPAFRRGVAHLGSRGLTYDTWHYHVQIRDFIELAKACPDTTMIHDHFGTPLGVDQYAGTHDAIFTTWSADITELSTCPNVVAKLGGMAMPDNGFGWRIDDAPATVEQFLDAQARWYHHTIEAFGPERCMFESNFPVDKLSLTSETYWAAMSEIASNYSAAEQDALFRRTADRVYALG